MAAWAVNQVVRGERRKASSLLDAGERLRASQEGLADGTTGAEELRRAGEEERRAVSDLVEVARALERGEQLSATVLQRVSDTLHASTLDEDVRRRVEAGRLAKESAAIGFGGFTTATVAPAARPARKAPQRERRRAQGEKKTAKEANARGEETARKEESAARERERAAKDELRRTEARLAEEKDSRSDARNAVREAKRERDRLQKELDRAERALSEADERVKSLDQEAREARRRVAELRMKGR